MFVHSFWGALSLTVVLSGRGPPRRGPGSCFPRGACQPTSGQCSVASVLWSVQESFLLSLPGLTFASGMGTSEPESKAHALYGIQTRGRSRTCGLPLPCVRAAPVSLPVGPLSPCLPPALTHMQQLLSRGEASPASPGETGLPPAASLPRCLSSRGGGMPVPRSLSALQVGRLTQPFDVGRELPEPPPLENGNPGASRLSGTGDPMAGSQSRVYPTEPPSHACD